MNKTKKTVIGLLAAGLAVALLVTLFPAVNAQVGTFGTQVKLGDGDFVPTVNVAGAYQPRSAVAAGNIELGDDGADGGGDDRALDISADALNCATQDVDEVYDAATNMYRVVALAGIAAGDFRILHNTLPSESIVRAGDADLATVLTQKGTAVGNCGFAGSTAADDIWQQGEDLYINPGDGAITADVDVADVRGTTVLWVLQRTFGSAGDLNDDGFYLDMDRNGAVSRYDLRLKAFGSNAAGTLVLDADTTEISTVAQAAVNYVTSVYADVNNNGRYDLADVVYLTTSSAGGFVASTAVNVFSLRLSAAGGKAAGTIVFNGDTDLTSYGTSALVLGGGIPVSFDKDLDGAVSTGDSVWFASEASTSGIAAGSDYLVPLFSVRLAGGTFGSQVAFGDADFKPTLQAGTSMDAGDNDGGACTANAEVKFLWRDLGTAGDMNDNPVYLDVDASETVSRFDVRLKEYGGKAAGTLVTDSDTTELGGAGAVGCAGDIRWADVNNNARLDTGDCVFATTSPDANLRASTNGAIGGQWTLRLTGCSGKAAGTLVFATEADFTAYNGANNLQLVENFAFFDGDRSRTFDTADRGYLSMAGADAALGSLVPLYAVRVYGGTFGTLVVAGDSDFVPAIGNALADADLQRCALGTANDFTDDGYYLDTNAGATVTTFDVRLTAFGGKAAGTLLTDADTTELGCQANAGGTRFTTIDTDAAANEGGAGPGGEADAATDWSIVYADVNNDGRYNEGDYVYATTSTATAGVGGDWRVGAPASASSAGAGLGFSIRLTAAGTFAAGTLVKAGDSDLVSYGTAIRQINPDGVDNADDLDEVRPQYFNEDNDAGPAFGVGDDLYIAVLRVGILGPNNLVPLYSIRLVGQVPTSTTTPTTTTTTTTGNVTTTTGNVTTTTTPPTTTTTPPTTSPTTTPTTPPTTTKTTSKTPGLEVIAVVGGVAAAAVVVYYRRK